MKKAVPVKDGLEGERENGLDEDDLDGQVRTGRQIRPA